MAQTENNCKRLRVKAKDYANNREYRFNIEFFIFMEDDNYIAYCPSLDLSTSGKTFNEAQGNFYEMFELYVQSCSDRSTLLQDLSEHGWKVQRQSITPPSFATQLKKPEFKKLMNSQMGYSKVVSPAELPLFV